MSGSALDPGWQRAPSGRFHRLFDVDPEEQGLSRASGVYVIWHAGGRPEWVYVGSTRDLAATLHARGEDKEIADYDLRGGLFVTWAFVREEYQDGVVRFLIDELQPVVANPHSPGSSVKPVAVRLPGQ